MNIPKISALYESSLASSLSAAGTSFSVVSGTDRDGNALSGSYGFILDEGSADEEFVIGSISGTTVTITFRGIDANAPNTEISANKKAHRRGASVKITDYPIMGVLRDILNGDESLPNPLKYTTGIGPVSADDLVDKGYADALAISGAGLASTSTAGLAEEATEAEIDADTAAGSVARLFVNPSTLATSKYGDRLPSADEKSALAGGGSFGTPSSSNKFITQDYNASASGKPVVRVYTSNDSWSKPAGLKYVIAEVVGGGGGGGGSTTANTNCGGGGGGGYSREMIPVASLGATETVTIGAAGTAGAATGGTGGTGGTTSFGSHLQATGGVGGEEGTDKDGGAGGIGSNGDLNIQGGGGSGGNGEAGHASGAGGSSHLGGGGKAQGGSSDIAGVTGGVYGGGGSGAHNISGNDLAGGAGAAGVVIITEYYS